MALTAINIPTTVAQATTSVFARHDVRALAASTAHLAMQALQTVERYALLAAAYVRGSFSTILSLAGAHPGIIASFLTLTAVTSVAAFALRNRQISV